MQLCYAVSFNFDGRFMGNVARLSHSVQEANPYGVLISVLPSACLNSAAGGLI
jgi:hypothetical protein